jgi:hypothetical protein
MKQRMALLLKSALVPAIFIFFVHHASSEENDTVFYIHELSFDIKGRTTEYTLIRKSEVRIGERIKGLSALQDYIAQKTQALTNQRQLQEVHIESILNEADENGFVPVDLIIHTKDTNNIIAFPEPRYSSSKGWNPTLKIRDYNFLGGMEEFYINIAYNYQDADDITFSRGNLNLVLGFEIPFKALGRNWKFITENRISYFINESFLFNSRNGIYVEIPWKKTTFTFGFDEELNFNKEYDIWDKYTNNTNVRDLWYMASRIYGEWKLPLPVSADFLGALTYKPFASGNIDYSLRGEDLGDLNGPGINFGQRLGFEKIDWIGNFKKGAQIYIENTNDYNCYFESWNNTVTLNASGFFPITGGSALYARARFIKWFINSAGPSANPSWEVGELIRGTGDTGIHAQAILVFNFDWTFHIIDVMISDWLKNEKLHYIDFELQAAPVIDIAMIDGSKVDKKRNSAGKISFLPEDWIVGAGFEVFAFPYAFRSIFLRFSAAQDVSDSLSKDNYEIYIGLGYHY